MKTISRQEPPLTENVSDWAPLKSIAATAFSPPSRYNYLPWSRPVWQLMYNRKGVRLYSPQGKRPWIWERDYLRGNWWCLSVLWQEDSWGNQRIRKTFLCGHDQGKDTPAHHIRGISVRNLQIGKPLLYRQGTYPIPPPHKEILSFIFNVSYIPIIIFNSKFEWSFIRNVLFKQLSNKTHIKLFKGHPFTIGLLIFTNYIISVF